MAVMACAEALELKSELEGNTVFSPPVIFSCGKDDAFDMFQLRSRGVIEVGSSATVVLAEPIKEGNPLKAMKVFQHRAKNYRDHFDLKQFLVEVSIMQGLDHPNVMCQVMAASCFRYYAIRMKYYPNGDMLERLAERKLSTPLRERYTAQLACAVRYLHSVRVCHGDIKLENMLLDENNDLVLSDFGHSQILPPGSDYVTIIGGTKPYQAPEVATKTSESALDAFKLDSYAVGVSIWAMVTRMDVTGCKRKHYMTLLEKRPFSKSAFRFLLTYLLLEDPNHRWSIDQLCGYLKTFESMKDLMVTL